ncbi:hypothetical protein [Methanobrevibacter sp.]|uniref:hypothetical protein n=1 Tax=Methanobrevibacter sp. TaxID=66852 RepID=UPI0038691D01
MTKKIKFVFILIILLFLAIGAVSASDSNSTDIIKEEVSMPSDDSLNEDALGYSENNNELSSNDNTEISKDNADDLNTKSNEKSDAKITPHSNFVRKGENYYIYLTDKNGDGIANKKLSIEFNGNTYVKTTDEDGKVGIKVSLSEPTSSMTVKFHGDDEFHSVSKTLDFYIDKTISIKIGNKKLITNGYLRIYLSGKKKYIAHKTIEIRIGNKVFTKKTNEEGFVVIKPEVGSGIYDVTVTYGNYKLTKRIKCEKGDVINPFEKAVPRVNGVPDIDLMPANFVMGDNNGKYKIKKSQYKEVLKRDSYSLYLYGKLSKYTFFKTKASPNVYHIIKREKWNVIERVINTKMVKKNQYKYWPKSVSVSLKGKEYTYGEVRDVQNKGYTCGPTSASMCSQALRNYYSEKYFQIKMHVTSGVNIPVVKNVLEKNKFKTYYYYRNSIHSAVNQVKKGGAALIAFLPNHYVAVIDASHDGKKILVSNSYGAYNVGGDSKVPTGWVSLKYFKSKFAGIGLVVKLNYKLSSKTKATMKNIYTSMGPNWIRQNTNERIPNT